MEDSEGFSPMKMARAGRRAGRNSAAAMTDQPAMQQDTEQASSGPMAASSDSGPPTKRVGFDMPAAAAGEQEEGLPSFPASFSQQQETQQQRHAGVSRRKQEQLQQEEGQGNRHQSKYDERTRDEGVMEIPELEEEGKEDLTRVVADAPRVRSHKVQHIEELDEDQAWIPAGNDNDIDLSLLTACLCPSTQVDEPDEIWNPDLLFASIKAELNQDNDRSETKDDNKEEMRQI